MSLQKMKDELTGKKIGYTNIDAVICRKTSDEKIKCTLKAVYTFNEVKEKKKPYHIKELICKKVRFEHLTWVEQSPEKVEAFTAGKMACYVNSYSGIITCFPKEELK